MNYRDHLNKLQYFESTAGNMAYIDEGHGKVILLLHGVPTSSWLYRKIIPELSKQGYRVIVPDMVGYGASDKSEGYEIYSDEATGRRIIDLMDFLGIGQWTHVFHDGGGLWTWTMLQEDSSRVNQLIMLNTIVYQEGFKPPLRFEQGKIARFYTKLYSTRLGQRFLIHPTFNNGIHDKSAINNEMLEGYKAPFLNKGSHALYYFFTQTCRQVADYTELHRSLDMPLTVIWGKHDDMLVWDNISDIVRTNFNLAPKDVHILNGKHFIQEECAPALANIILARMRVEL